MCRIANYKGKVVKLNRRHLTDLVWFMQREGKHIKSLRIWFVKTKTKTKRHNDFHNSLNLVAFSRFIFERKTLRKARKLLQGSTSTSHKISKQADGLLQRSQSTSHKAKTQTIIKSQKENRLHQQHFESLAVIPYTLM